MPKALESLKDQLSNSRALTSKTELGDLLVFSIFPKLTKLLSKIESSSQNKEKQPTNSRIEQAILKFIKEPSNLNRAEWRYLFWGLNFKLKDDFCLIDDDVSFAIIENKINRMIIDNDVTKGIWFALCASYFANSDGQGKNNKKLQNLLASSLNSIEQNASVRKKTWVSLVRNNYFILSPQAKQEFLKLIVKEKSDRISEINRIFYISDNSWLWKSVFNENEPPNLLSILNEINDQKFHELIPDLIQLIEKYPLQKYIIFAHILERYRYSANYQDSDPQLKLIALDNNMWGNPQLASYKKNWDRYVTPEVLRMVLNWFAKDDLIHFFSLLRSADSMVDERRLDFWLEYIDHIAFTRIVMGTDAYMNKSFEFVEFIKANRNRLSYLEKPPTTSVNAFIIRIEDYWFVEFSETGSACYVYDNRYKPFDETARSLHFKDELKVKSSARERINHQGDWESRTRDLFRYELGLDI